MNTKVITDCVMFLSAESEASQLHQAEAEGFFPDAVQLKPLARKQATKIRKRNSKKPSGKVPCVKVKALNESGFIDFKEITQGEPRGRFFKWLMENRTFGARVIRAWCSDFTPEDAADAFSELCERLVEKGEKNLGKPTRKNLLCHLRREKENFRRRESAIKRGGNIEHESLDSLEEWKQPTGKRRHAHYSDAFRELDKDLKSISLEPAGRLALLAGVMRRVIHYYSSPRDLFDAMTLKERSQFIDRDYCLFPHKSERHTIMKQISRTLSVLRDRLIEMRTESHY